MSGTTGSGVAVGIASSDTQSQRKSGGGLSVFSSIPKLIFPVIVYAIAAFILGDMSSTLFALQLPSGAWAISLGDLLLMIALIFLFIEMVQSAGSGTATLLNNGLSFGVFVICLLLFLLVPLFATSVFFLITLMTLIDAVAGVTITAIAARRDLGT